MLDVKAKKRQLDRTNISERHAFWLTAALAFFIACVMFIPPLVADRGMLTLHGDFDEQQIAFNMHSNDIIKSGRIGWDWSVDLGSSFVGAFGFYTLGSPFFWLSALFPANAFPYLVAWLYILKYVAAAMAAFVYVKHYLRKIETACIVSLLYAFSGFSQINLLFYHFHEVIALFPLLLWSLDRLVIDKKRGYFASLIAFSALINYFFFVGEVLFVLIYYAFRHAPELRRQRKLAKTTLICLIEGVSGGLMASVLLLPSLLLVMRNPRTAGTPLSLRLLIFPLSRYFAILKGLLLPAETMAGQAAFIQHDFSSNALYLPLIGPALLYPAKRGDARWLKRLLFLCLIFAVVPFLNSAFYVFTRQYYARWFYMPLLMMALLSGRNFEQMTKRSLYRGYVISGGLFLLLIGAIFYAEARPEFSDMRLERLPLLLTIGAAGLAVSFVVLLLSRRDLKKRGLYMLVMVVLFSLITGSLGVGLLRKDRRAIRDDKYFEYKARLAGERAVPQGEPGMRFLLNRQVTNLPTMLDMPSANSFISTIAPSLLSFYEEVGNARYVSTKVSEYSEAFLSALSVDRVFTRHEDVATTLLQKNHLTHVGSWQADQETLQHFENPYAVPLGFGHTHYVAKSAFAKQPDDIKRTLLLKALVVEDIDLAKVSTVLTPLPASEWTTEQWQEAALERKEQTPLNFSSDHRGFEATYNLQAPTYVWFSVPHEPGFRAFVNGAETKIETSLSMMALLLPAGESVVRFAYATPGLKMGLGLSAIGLIACIWLLMQNLRKLPDDSD